MADRKPQDQDRYIVRFPNGMREQLKTAAEANNRSLNAEIVARLEESMMYSPPVDFLRLGKLLSEQNAELISITVVGNVREVLLRDKTPTQVPHEGGD